MPEKTDGGRHPVFPDAGYNCARTPTTSNPLITGAYDRVTKTYRTPLARVGIFAHIAEAISS